MLEQIIDFSLKHRVAIVTATFVIAAFGAISLTKLPIDAVPDITNNQVQVNTVVPSLTPLEVEKQVTFPIETALAGIPGMKNTRSLSRNGFSQVTAIFEDAVSIYFARQQVAERLREAADSLPAAVEPKLGPISTGLGEVYMWTVTFDHPGGTGAAVIDGNPGWQSDGSYRTPEGEQLITPVEQASYLRTVQDWIIRPQLRTVPGVAGVDSIGGYVKQYHVQPDPTKLVAFGLTFRDLIEALENNNVSTGAGYIEHQGDAYVVRATGRFATPGDIAQIMVAENDGIPIRIQDVAAVGIGAELRTGSASENGREAVVGTALMLIGENSRSVAEAVDAKMQAINKSLPPDVRAKTTLNRMALVDETIYTVEKNLVEGAILVIVVLLLLLGNLRAALVTALSIPLAMLLTAIGMVKTGTSGNLMSLGALDFGLIVDGAVIIVENCLRRLAESQHRLGRPLSATERAEVCREATVQVLSPAAYGTAIIITVYIPILFLTGIEGKMFHPMALTVIFALLAAFALSLTFVPAAVALVVSGSVAEKDNLLQRWATRLYAPVVDFALQYRKATIGVGVSSFLLAVALFGRLGQEFIPTLSELDLAVHAIRIPSTGITQSQQMQFEVERAVMATPEVAFTFSKTGTAEVASDPMPPNVSDTFVILKKRSEWPDPRVTKEDVRARIQEQLEAVAGNNYEFTQPIQMRFNELIAGVRGDVAVKLFGDEFETMVPVAEQILGELNNIPGAADGRTEQVEGLPTLSVDVDRAALARYGLSVADVHDVVAAAIGGRSAGLLFEGDRRFEIMVRLPETYRSNLTALGNLPIPRRRLPEHGADSGDLGVGSLNLNFIPLAAVGQIALTEGPNQVSRDNGKRRVVIQTNVRGRDLGSFVEEAQARVAKAVSLPPGSWLQWGGQYENLVAAKQRLTIVVPICFLVIFLLLFGSFGSVRDALLVFSGVPLALSGGVIALWLRSMPFSISAAVGFIALSGVAVLNSIVLVSFINELRSKGRGVELAIREGCLVRLRPVLMTALVASLGFVPMALATGTGAEVQRPLATVVIGGIVSSTLLTLLVLPALYRSFSTEKRQS